MKNAYSKIETANRYDSARSLPSQTKTQWLDALRSSIPEQQIRKILDLGCGTGRFTAALGKAFECSVVGVEPSRAMLGIAMSQSEPNVEWKQGFWMPHQFDWTSKLQTTPPAIAWGAFMINFCFSVLLL